MERHIIYEMIDGFDFKIQRHELKYFTKDFRNYYNLIEKMRVKGLPVNKDQVILYAIIDEVELDKHYPKKNDKIPIERLRDTIELYIKGKVEETEFERMGRLVEASKSGDRDSLEELERLVAKKSGKDESADVVDLADIMPQQLSFIERIKSQTPLEGLYLYNGGTRQFMKLSYQLKLFDTSDLVVIAGRPSVGKTSFAVALANALSKNGYRGLFFSLEMTNDQLMQRMAIAKSGISINALMNPKGIDDRTYNAYKSALDRVARTKLKVVENPPIVWKDIEKTIYNEKDNIDYIIIDHLNYIRSYQGEVATNQHNLVTNVTSAMKQLAKELGKPIILLAQFSRSLASQTRRDDRYIEPFMRDLRESGSIEQDADKILLLYREWEDYETREAYERFGRYKVNCKIDKNRAGQSGRKVQYWFHANIGRWEEIEIDDKGD